MEVPSYDELLKPVKLIMIFIGIPFKQAPQAAVRFYVTWIMVLCMIILEVGFIVKATAKEFLELTALVPCASVGALAITKTGFIYIHRNSMMDLVKRLEILYKQIHNDINLKNLVLEDLKFLKRVTLGYAILNQVLIWTYNLSSVMRMIYIYVTEGELKFLLSYPFALPFALDTWLKWSLVYSYSFITAYIAVISFCMVDCLYYALTGLICINFQILNSEIKKMSLENCDNLPDLIKSHQYLLDLSSQLETIFTGCNLANVLLGSLQICSLGFNLTIGGWDQIPPSVLFISSVLLQIFMMSMFGEQLIEQSGQVCASVYSCDWINMDVKTRKLLIIMQRRALRPQVLTAHKFSVISYQGFTRIISTSWSYFTILRTVFNPTNIEQIISD